MREIELMHTHQPLPNSEKYKSKKWFKEREKEQLKIIAKRRKITDLKGS